MITHCSFDEVFVWSDNHESRITITGDDLMECDMPSWSEGLAQKMMFDEYYEWIAGTEPGGWVDVATSIRIDGWFYDFDARTYEFASINIK